MRTVDKTSPIRHAFVSEEGILGFAWTGGILLFVVLTGLLIWLAPFGAGVQIAVMLHTLLGLLVIVPFALWQLSHWLATRRAQRRPRKISAYCGFWLLAASVVSGLVLTWQAVLRTVVGHVWSKVHLWTGVLCVPFVIYHLLPQKPQADVPPEPARQSAEERLVPIELQDYGVARRRTWKRAFAVTAALSVVLIALTAMERWATMGRYEPPASFIDAQGPNPFAPSNANLETGRPVSPQTIGDSRSCGVSGCHATIYEEWRASAHRWSEQDEFFQAVRSATTEVQGIRSTEKCGGCHAPVTMLSGYKDPRLGNAVPGYEEGDSCIVCHAVRHVDERGIGSYVLGIPRPYLFEHSGSPYALAVNHFLIRAFPGQHDRDYDLNIARGAESCAPCHKEYDKLPDYPSPLEVETQYDDWKANQWNTDPDKGRRLTCQQCHMFYKTADRPAQAEPYDLKVGLGLKHHNHRFAAANAYMPLALNTPGGAEQVRDVKEWLTGRQTVPEIQKVWPSGPIVSIEIKAPSSVQPGATMPLQVVLTNKKAGHSFPTGPLNVVRVWLELDVRDSAGKEVFHSGGVDGGNHVQAGSYVLRPIALTESGAPLVTKDVWHPQGLQFRPAISPGKSESFAYDVRVPAGMVGPLVVRATLHYRKANQFFMDAVYTGQHKEAPVEDVSSGILRLDVTGGAVASRPSAPHPPKPQR
ncbi:MAG TPA: multiheme c-type cytochrome [Terriglobales bacterium]|nr:multiheme c-type cytochrome [Terriglobales bacterium]